MKSRLFPRLVAVGALIAPVAAFAQTSPATFPPVGSSSSTSSSNNPSYGTVAQQPSPGSVARVNQEQLSRTFTARDLIGKNVYNHEGERLGTINDVGLSKAWVERFGAPNREPGSDAPPPSSTQIAPLPGSDLIVYVSTGGVLGLQGRFGVRADWVSVSADSLMYDRHNDRFILNMPHAQFSAVAQGRSTSEVYSSTGNQPASSGTSGTIGAPVNTPSNYPGSAGSSNYPGSYGSSNADVRQIQEALANHSDLRNRARIQVSHTGSAIQLTGVVDNADLLRRAGDIARQHTRLEVRNMLEVGRPFAAE